VIVVDASAAVLGLLNDGDARGYLADEPFACPHLADSEIVHALRGRVRNGEIDPADAERALATWARLGMERVPIVGLLERLWSLR
jgi:predicted nucleic acid-binding protein